MKAGFGLTGLLVAECGIRKLRRERDLLILKDGMRDSFRTQGGRGVKNGKSHVTDVTRRTATVTRRVRDKYSNWGWLVGLKDLALNSGGMRD